MPARKLPAPAEAAVAARMLLDGLAEDQNVPAGMLLGPTDPPAAVDRGQPHARPRRLVGDLWWREVGIEPGWLPSKAGSYCGSALSAARLPLPSSVAVHRYCLRTSSRTSSYSGSAAGGTSRPT